MAPDCEEDHQEVWNDDIVDWYRQLHLPEVVRLTDTVTFRPLLLTAELIWAPLAPGLWVLKLVLVIMPANFTIHLGRTVVLQNQRSGFAEGLLRITQACTNYSHQFSH